MNTAAAAPPRQPATPLRRRSARLPCATFVACAAGARLCIPIQYLGGGGPGPLVLMHVLQFPLVAITFGAAAVYRHRTRVYGEHPAERPPIVLGQPRKVDVDWTPLLRTVAGFAIVVSALYALALLGLFVRFAY